VSGRPATRYERASDVVSRAYNAWLWSAATLATYNTLGGWWAFGLTQFPLVLTIVYGLYALGLKAGSDER
jgi:hypothetical protein